MLATLLSKDVMLEMEKEGSIYRLGKAVWTKRRLDGWVTDLSYRHAKNGGEPPQGRAGRPWLGRSAVPWVGSPPTFVSTLQMLS